MPNICPSCEQTIKVKKEPSEAQIKKRDDLKFQRLEKSMAIEALKKKINEWDPADKISHGYIKLLEDYIQLVRG